MNYNECRFSRKTGAAATAFTLTPEISSINWWVYEVRIHLAGAATQETLTVSIDSDTNAVYDVTLFSQAMANLTDVVFRPDQPIPLAPGDTLKVDWANTDTETYGIEVVYGF